MTVPDEPPPLKPPWVATELNIDEHLSEDDKYHGVDDGYLAECTINTTLSDTAEIYAKRLYEKYLLRRVIFQTKKIEINAMDSRDDTYDTLIDAHTSLGELISIRLIQNLILKKL